ncbi:MAG: hemin ABC transporter substrate-binding protein [bacterium]
MRSTAFARRGRRSERRPFTRLSPLLYLGGEVLLFALLVLAPVQAAESPRLVTVGGDVTEIAYALGAGDQVVAADTSSVYPAAAAALPKVGYQRQLAAEGVLALTPTLVLVSDEAGPPTTLAQLRDAGMRVEVIEGDDSQQGAAQKVRRIAAQLHREAAGEALISAMQTSLAAAADERARAKTAPRVLFIYARGAGTVMVAGRTTPADAMITLAGARNAIEEFDGFKPLTAAAVVAAQPDVVLMLSRGVDSLGGAAAIWTQPGLAQTPAAAVHRLVTMDDLYLLGFGPRLGEAVRDLARQLHPELAAAP